MQKKYLEKLKDDSRSNNVFYRKTVFIKPRGEPTSQVPLIRFRNMTEKDLPTKFVRHTKSCMVCDASFI